MIYLTGDIHGSLTDDRYRYLLEAEPEDIFIFLGDFGYNWDQNLLDTFHTNCITLFLAGNHENYDVLNNLPRTEMFGSEVGVLKKNTYHLLNGHVYTINGKKFFIFGGAASIDRAYRTPYVSWWPDEIPHMREYLLAEATLKKYDYKIDYFLSHTAGTQTVKDFFHYTNGFKDPVEPMIDALESVIQGNYYHYFGHHHRFVTNGKHTCLYTEVAELAI